MSDLIGFKEKKRAGRKRTKPERVGPERLDIDVKRRLDHYIIKMRHSEVSKADVINTALKEYLDMENVPENIPEYKGGSEL